MTTKYSANYTCQIDGPLNNVMTTKYSANYTCQIDGPLNTVMAAVTHSVVVISQHSRSLSSLPVFVQSESAPKIIIT